MAQYLTNSKLLATLALVTCVMHWPPAMAEVLRDPTIPDPQSGLLPMAQLPAVAPPPMLQSITLGSTAKYAMINGQTIMLGQAYQQWILIKLTANEAILRAKDGTIKVLGMGYPFKKSNAAMPRKGVQIMRKSTIIPMADATPSNANATNNRLTEVPNTHTRVEAESVWVKQ